MNYLLSLTFHPSFFVYTFPYLLGDNRVFSWISYRVRLYLHILRAHVFISIGSTIRNIIIAFVENKRTWDLSGVRNKMLYFMLTQFVIAFLETKFLAIIDYFVYISLLKFWQYIWYEIVLHRQKFILRYQKGSTWCPPPLAALPSN